jgi:hypothetical protein
MVRLPYWLRIYLMVTRGVQGSLLGQKLLRVAPPLVWILQRSGRHQPESTAIGLATCIRINLNFTAAESTDIFALNLSAHWIFYTTSSRTDFSSSN